MARLRSDTRPQSLVGEGGWVDGGLIFYMLLEETRRMRANARIISRMCPRPPPEAEAQSRCTFNCSSFLFQYYSSCSKLVPQNIAPAQDGDIWVESCGLGTV